MTSGYYAAAWADVKATKGWFGQILRLGLVSLIPVFGYMVLYGRLFGWARQIAWNVQDTLPKKIFANPDGALYKRGFFALVIQLVFMIVPYIVYGIGCYLQVGLLEPDALSGDGGAFALLISAAAGLTLLLSSFLFLVAAIFAWVGSMRMSIYGTLRSGLQLGVIWKMIRHDFGGIMRIVGMYLLLSLIFIGIVSVISTMLISAIGLLILLMFGQAFGMGVPVVGSDSTYLALMLLLIVPMFLVLFYIAMCCAVFILTMVVRALGYWTANFRVAEWGRQDDPLPFERDAMSASGGTGL